jgi:succinate dehydrogenase / fumarate reductase cytochrome b subunit
VASSASYAAEPSARIPAGVAPLRAGQGSSFLLRRLHSLSGIFPIGAFLLEHYISNSYATNGVQAYNDTVKFLTSVPFVVAVETIFIYIPILYHALYGFWIWYRGDGNAGAAYPWSGNWLYTAQRWTGAVAFLYMGWHTWTMRFTGVHLLTQPGAGFSKVYTELQNPWAVAFYFVGITAASWHFAYGIWLFAAKWGITVGENARRRFGYLCLVIGIALVGIGFASLIAFLSANPAQVPPLQQFHAVVTAGH